MTRLREWRQARNLSQPQAAELLRTPLPTLRNWEQGRASPPAVLEVALDALDQVDRLNITISE
jgi:DNA-binding transcriptional regulator YiaG